MQHQTIVSLLKDTFLTQCLWLHLSALAPLCWLTVTSSTLWKISWTVRCMLNYLMNRPRGSAHCIHHPDGDQQGGGECEEASNSIAPPWVLIYVIELQWGVLNQGEDKGALWKKRNIAVVVRVRKMDMQFIQARFTHLNS